LREIFLYNKQKQAERIYTMVLKLKVIGSNQTEIKTNKHTVLFSYDTPVLLHTHYSIEGRPVVFITNGANEAGKQIRTKTTSRHINLYMKDIPHQWEMVHVDQEELENILANA
jgi:hypothetical protein